MSVTLSPPKSKSRTLPVSRKFACGPSPVMNPVLISAIIDEYSLFCCFTERQFSMGLSWCLANKDTDSFPLDCLIKNVWTTLEGRDNISLWSRRQIQLLFIRLYNNKCPSYAEIKQVCLHPIIKDWGFLNVRIFSWDANPLCEQHLPRLPCVTPVHLGGGGKGKGSWCKTSWVADCQQC